MSGRQAQDAAPIDRHAVVARHDPVITTVLPRSPLGVGNGEFAFTADLTGLQSLPQQYPVIDPAGGQQGTLLATQAQWAWHETPRPPEASIERSTRTYETARGRARYVDAPQLDRDDSALDPALLWLRANPHRLDLFRLGLVLLDGEPRAPRPEEVEGEQRLDLWRGVLHSRVRVAGVPLQVTTVVDPDHDAVGIRIHAPEGFGAIAVALALPYGSESWNVAADWESPERHRTLWEKAPRPAGEPGRGSDRELSQGIGVVQLGAQEPARHRLVRSYDDGVAHHELLITTAAEVVRQREHEFLVLPSGQDLELVVAARPLAGALALAGERAAARATVPGGEGTAAGANQTAAGANQTAAGVTPPPERTQPLDVAHILARSSAAWPAYWSSGAVLDLGAVADPRARELERRVVLSQYLTAVHCAGSLPPQETGLIGNSWRGKFHLEMHLWHAAHFPAWGRAQLLERSLGWYEDILPVARATAREQLAGGARWPKQVGPNGREAPSDIGPFLLWQQPHPILFAEQLRRAGVPGAVERWGGLVAETATFLSDVLERREGGVGLGPPLIPAQESYVAERAQLRDPPFELAYWRWALGVAQEWRVLSGSQPDPVWERLREGIVPPPVRHGTYAAVRGEPWLRRSDHPSMLYALGVVPDTGYIDAATMSATLDDVLAEWDWSGTWGWDYPAMAMTAARLGRAEDAVDLLLRDTPKNAVQPSGHFWQTDTLPAYLPGNGAILLAVALMAGGWDHDGGRPAPGFPADWQVRQEGFVRWG